MFTYVILIIHINIPPTLLFFLYLICVLDLNKKKLIYKSWKYLNYLAVNNSQILNIIDKMNIFA